MAGMTPHYLNSADAANVLDVTRERVRQLHAEGKLKADVYMSGLPGFRQETLETFAATRKRRVRYFDGDPCNGCGVPLTQDSRWLGEKGPAWLCEPCGRTLNNARTRKTLARHRAQAKAEGKCGHCFKAPRDPGRSWCGACREQHRKNAQRRKGTIPDPADSGAIAPWEPDDVQVYGGR